MKYIFSLHWARTPEHHCFSGTKYLDPGPLFCCDDNPSSGPGLSGRASTRALKGRIYSLVNVNTITRKLDIHLGMSSLSASRSCDK